MVQSRVGRRQLLLGGAGAVVLGGATAGGYELVKSVGGTTKHHRRHRVGHNDHPTISPPGVAISGRFFSKARSTTVGWTISYPPGLRQGDQLPLVLALHGFTGDHVHPLGPVPPVQLLAALHDGRALAPMAIAAVDGGNDYWHVHPNDDPMRMLLEEFLPLCHLRGLGLGAHHKIAVAGVSMGGYGSLLLAEEHPELVAAVAVISPAVWTTYADSQLANPNAFTSPADFAAHDVITHASVLRGIPIRLASGDHDPFHPYVEVLVSALPRGAQHHFPPGSHDNAFFAGQALPTLDFLSGHIGQ